MYVQKNGFPIHTNTSCVGVSQNTLGNHLQVGFTSLQAWWNEDAEMDGDDVAGSRLGYVFMFTYVWWCVRLDYEYTLHEKLYNLIK